MDLNLLKAFDAVMKTQSVNAAADVLNITAPAISHSLNRLRDQYQDPLFVRQGRGIVPTNFAIELHAEIQEPLSFLLNGAKSRKAFDPNVSQRTFRISSHKDIDLLIVPPLTNYKKQHAPNINIKADVEHLDEQDRQNDLIRRKVDVILATVPLQDHGYHNQLLFEQELLVAVRKQHPRVQTELTLDSFVNEAHIIWRTGRLNTLLLESLSTMTLPERKIAYATGSNITALALTAETDWLCVTSRWHGKKYADALGLNTFPVPFETKKVPVYMTWHHSQNKDTGHEWFRQAIVAAVEEISLLLEPEKDL
ncbi:transcriptional regulator [Vibrio sp. 10N.286.49.C2]|uniref:LysR family transcriptional regulator n=1 Tax=unclassified Vibrio TaxID=2614977 RepID=UPI000C866331|nr:MULTISPECIES: LysR family transcriptional regulator [unclassified Vibrio]PMH38098.1 transcriptional regulator [Vibrio sp. 10N.286.49.C2]PMH53696.1 transcriptional regulator [Vibrio sp. 10N.286.49.B1]PMH80153.1 transcriptional regulator [Vibrio sp. 10N.286.48.B7]